MKVLIANSNTVHTELVNLLVAETSANVVRTPEELSAFCSDQLFDYIFFMHWSFLIPATVFDKQECVLFHMTDLPYGRGGSPLQNLIVRGHTMTKLSAIKVSEGLDTGPVYLKQDLSLHGTAREIFLRAGILMYDMIHGILRTRPKPTPQEGTPTLFKRRKPAEGNMANIAELAQAFDFIRMLDADGYPSAFVETDNLRFEFSRATLYAEQIIADVRITKK